MLIDANIFLEVILDQEKCEKSKEFLRKILFGDEQAFISTFSIDSIVLIMLRNKLDYNKIKLFLGTLTKYKGLRFYQIRINDRIKALNFMKDYKLDYEDALVLQSAISTKSDKIVSFDKDFDGIKGIRRREP